MKLKKAGGFVLDVLFPKRCVWCGKVVGFTQGDACGEALAQICLEEAPLDLALHEGAQGCLEAAWACFRYEDPVKHTIWRLKFEKDETLALPLGEKLAQKALACGLGGRYDVVAPVPVSAKTRKTRGFNQSALMAKQLAKQTGLPYDDRLLAKVFDTARQMDLGREERRTNVAGAFEAGKARLVQGKRVLLVDDVMTTGSTLGECAKTLLAAGAQSCGALCVAQA